MTFAYGRNSGIVLLVLDGDLQLKIEWSNCNFLLLTVDEAMLLMISWDLCMMVGNHCDVGKGGGS